MTHKGWHCAYDTHYHIVFPVKYRKALLSDRIAAAIKEIARGIEERYDLEVEQLGCDEDHIHLLVSFHPKYAIGDVVRLFKSVTAKQLFVRFPEIKPEIKKDLWGRRVLDRRLLCRHGRRAGKLVGSGTLRQKPRETRCEAVEIMVS